ncbi:Receptor like protein kinase S.2 [Capsicum chinense]|nr:Receptor like protein kinase S.2 [Capsicum chinense]
MWEMSSSRFVHGLQWTGTSIPRCLSFIEGTYLFGLDSDASTVHGELTIWGAVPDVFILLNRMTENVGIGDTIMEVDHPSLMYFQVLEHRTSLVMSTIFIVEDFCPKELSAMVHSPSQASIEGFVPKGFPGFNPHVEALSGHIYGNLPDLPCFKSHPLYISLSSPSSSTTSNTITTRSTANTSTSTTPGFNSTVFTTATGETMYLSAESGNSNNESENSSSRRQSSNFLMVETAREITFKEIIAATNNFSDSRRVAEIDFGTAYHGFLDNNQHVLVKRLGMKTCPALRVRFSNELQNLGRLRHRNLVQLRGWCTEQGEMLVIYDYSQSSLLSHLLFHHNHHRDNVSILRRRHRYNIVKSVASAIRYLHEEWDEQVIHRCITSSAIILDPDMNPRLGCFALAEFLTRNEHSHHVVVDKNKSVRGIFGYMSPEHMDSGDATTMADVYSFGVVLLEIVSGQMAVDFRRPEALLVNRVHEFEVQKRPYEQLADFRLNGNFISRELLRLVKLGMACTRSDPESRPTMRKIVNILDGHDQWLMENGRKKEKPEEWRTTNASALSLVRRIQALGIQ